MKAEISCGVYSSAPIDTRSPEPIRRLMESTVRSGAAAAWLRASRPTMTLPASSSPTHEGTMASPSSRTTSGRPPARIATSELVVPRSMPMIGSVSIEGHSCVSIRFTATSASRGRRNRRSD